MANTIDVAYVNQFKANIELLAQQKGTKLEDKVRVEMQNSEYSFYDQISKITTLTENPAQHADTAILDTPHSRRRVSLNSYFWADLVDKFDQVKMLADPKSPYAEAAAYAFGRQKDKSIIACFNGTAYTGKTGATSTTFPTSNIISSTTSGSYNATWAGSTAVLNVDKLRGAQYLLDMNDVPEDGRYFVGSPKQKADLLNTTQVTSSDYNSVKALVNGDVSTYMGFDFVWTTLITAASGTGIYECFAWQKDSMLLAIGEDDLGMAPRVTERDDKNFSVQLFNKMFIGCTRMDELGVIQVECT